LRIGGEKVAERRMIAKTIIDSDAFLDMPQSTQLLYFHLGMRAANKGLLNNVYSISRCIGCGKEDVEMLIERGFINRLSDGWFKIIHWDENNGIGETAKKRISYEYRKWRESVLIRDGYTCKNCGAKEKVMNVHHIKPFSNYVDLRYDINNGVSLCEKCHRAIHKKEA
jgi:hypothetical protein